MPASPAPTILKDDLLEQTIQMQLCGQTILAVLHWKANFEDEPLMNEAFDAFDTHFRDVDELYKRMQAAGSANLIFVSHGLQMVHPTRYARVSYPLADVGTQINDANTADLAGVIVKKGWFTGERSLKLGVGKTGMLHWAAVPNLLITEGIIDGTYRTNFLGPIGEKITQPFIADGEEWLPVLVSFGADPIVSSEVTSYEVKPEARVMRRRTVGVGI